MVTVDPPVLVTVSDRPVLLPTWTLPNARLVGFALNDPCATPVPESGMETVAVLAMEFIVNVQLAAPAIEGVKMVLNVAACPALRVMGRLGPVKLKPPRGAAALDTVTLAPPVFVTATGTV